MNRKMHLSDHSQDGPALCGAAGVPTELHGPDRLVKVITWCKFCLRIRYGAPRCNSLSIDERVRQITVQSILGCYTRTALH